MGFFDAIKSALGGKAAEVVGQAVPARPAQAASPAPEPAEAEPAEESSDDDGDGFKRDYDLEAKDDSASFDLKEDLAGYYVAEFRIEQAWDDVDARTKLFAEYGVRNEQHYYQVKATVDRYIESPAAQQKYGGIGEIMHVKMKATQDYMMGGMQQKLARRAQRRGRARRGRDPRSVGKCQVKIVSGGNLDESLRGLGIDKAKWDGSAPNGTRACRATPRQRSHRVRQRVHQGVVESGGQFSEPRSVLVREPCP